MKKKVFALLTALCLVLGLAPGTALAGGGSVPVRNYEELVAEINARVAEGKTGYIGFIPAEDFGWPEGAVLTVPVNLGLSCTAWEIPAGATLAFETNSRGLSCSELTIKGTIQTAYSSQDNALAKCTKVIVAPGGTFTCADGKNRMGHYIAEGKVWEVQKGADLNAAIQLSGELTGEGTVSGNVDVQGAYNGQERNAVLSGSLTLTGNLELGTRNETYADTLTIPAGSHIKLNQGGSLVVYGAGDTLALDGTLECQPEAGEWSNSFISFRAESKIEMGAGSELIFQSGTSMGQNLVQNWWDATQEEIAQYPCLISGAGTIKVYGEEPEYNIFNNSPDDIVRFLENDNVLIPAEVFIDFSNITLWRSWNCDHVWDEGTVTREPGCTEPGVKTVTCTVCGMISNQDVPAKGHTEEAIPAVEPTLTNVGYTEGTKCSVCGVQLKAPEMVPALFADVSPVVEDGKLTVQVKPQQEVILLCAFYDAEGRFQVGDPRTLTTQTSSETFAIPEDSSSYALFIFDGGLKPMCESYKSGL